MKLLITVPTYNEIENIEHFINTVFSYAPDNSEMLVVDDNSPDGTGKIVEKLFNNYSGRLHLLNRPSKQGLAQAYLAAFNWGLFRNYDIFLEMDADFSHDPKYISEMLKQIEIYDVVIGSRNIADGGVEGWSFLRNFISKGGSSFSGIVLNCPIKDLTGGFNMWRKTVLEGIGLSKIISKGYSFQIEMKYRAYCAGYSIKEIPILFKDRKLGTSKMSKSIFFEALVAIWKIKNDIGINSGIDQFIKFAITGGLGSITNLLIFYFCVDMFNLPEIPVSIVCFLIAATQNYIINHKWSFKNNTNTTTLSIEKWLLFISSALLGLAINIIVMKMILLHWILTYKFIAQACGIAAGMIVNFIFAKFIVFIKEGKKDE